MTTFCPRLAKLSAPSADERILTGQKRGGGQRNFFSSCRLTLCVCLMAKGKGENRDLGPSPWVEEEEEEEEDGWGGRLKGKRDRRQTDCCVASYARVYCTTLSWSAKGGSDLPAKDGKTTKKSSPKTHRMRNVFYPLCRCLMPVRFCSSTSHALCFSPRRFSAEIKLPTFFSSTEKKREKE